MTRTGRKPRARQITSERILPKGGYPRHIVAVTGVVTDRAGKLDICVEEA